MSIPVISYSSRNNATFLLSGMVDIFGSQQSSPQSAWTHSALMPTLNTVNLRLAYFPKTEIQRFFDSPRIWGSGYQLFPLGFRIRRKFDSFFFVLFYIAFLSTFFAFIDLEIYIRRLSETT